MACHEMNISRPIEVLVFPFDISIKMEVFSSLGQRFIDKMVPGKVKPLEDARYRECKFIFQPTSL